jgi:glutamine amidotransferase
MIALVDYGAGNLRSVAKALEAVGAEVIVTSDGLQIQSAEKVILPGVGAFGDGMLELKRCGLVEVLQAVVEDGTPLLGICLGMQMLFKRSSELGNHPGLGFLPGSVRRFGVLGLKIPQTGWNQIQPVRRNPLLRGINPGDYAYFNHSYYCDPGDESHVLAQTPYGAPYASVVGRPGLYGVQFHPEKSQSIGLKILRNFLEYC